MLQSDIITIIEKTAPLSLMAEWDRSGVQVASPRKEIRHLAVCLDPAPEQMAAAVENGADMVLTHHPLAMRPEWTNRLNGYTDVLRTLYSRDVPLYSCHTSLDANPLGPSAWPSRLAPDLLGAIAVAAYSYMALVPIIQPPIMKALTTKAERAIKMPALREVKKIEKICFPLIVLLLCAVLLPSAVPLIGALMLGNLAKEAGPSVARIADTMSNALINIVTIMLGLSVGSKLACEKFLSGTTLGILALGLCAFCVGTAAGVLMAKLMNAFSKTKVNPLIGSAGVSAVPMAARVSNKVSLSEDPTNFILMQAMGPNVSGVIGSAVVAGVLYTLCR